MRKSLFLFGLLPMLWSCSDSNDQQSLTPEETPYTPIELSAETRSVADLNNEFSFKVYNLSPEVTNHAIAPFSIFSTFAMIANGDSGEARDEMLRILGYEAETIDALNSYCRIMNAKLPKVDSRTTISLTNSIWHSKLLTVNLEFKELLSDIFTAETFDQPVNTPEGMEMLNAWVSKNTNGMIPTFLKQPMDFPTVFVNTIYFNGQWKEKFLASDTKNEVFHNADGSQKNIPFMNQSKPYTYFNDGVREGVELPYGNGNFSMTVIRNIDSTVPSIDAREYSEFIKNGSGHLVKLSLPKFEATTDLTYGANRFGIEKGTNPGYNGIVKEGYLPISMVIHGMSIKVSEEGTEAAAVTGGGMSSMGGYNPITLKFNSPFIYIIRETSTNTILFMGRQEQF